MAAKATPEELLKLRWCWRRASRGYYLATESCGGLAVLYTVSVGLGRNSRTELAVRDADGVLVPLTPDCPVAKAIREVPELISAVRCMADLLRDAKAEGAMAEHVQQVVAEAEAILGRIG